MEEVLSKRTGTGIPVTTVANREPGCFEAAFALILAEIRRQDAEEPGTMRRMAERARIREQEAQDGSNGRE
jgi:hypothetical protein